jgi:hypothetical protein
MSNCTALAISASGIGLIAPDPGNEIAYHGPPQSAPSLPHGNQSPRSDLAIEARHVGRLLAEARLAIA